MRSNIGLERIQIENKHFERRRCLENVPPGGKTDSPRPISANIRYLGNILPCRNHPRA